MKKVVSYSLWCQEKPMDNNPWQTGNMYCNGAIRNLEIQKEKNIYSDWIFRYYIDNTVSKDVQDRLKELGAELIDMTCTKLPGMFWRFLCFDDPTIDIFIVRDTDSRVNIREENAVNEWLKSDKLLHIMRDHPHHHYKILGGMWGYKNYLQKYEILEKINNFQKNRNYKFKRMDDMIFLDEIYDLLKGKSLEHDDFFTYEYSQPFPNHILKTNDLKFVGEIFDENDNNPNKSRDKKIILEYDYNNKKLLDNFIHKKKKKKNNIIQ